MTRFVLTLLAYSTLIISACGGGGVTRRPQPLPPGTNPATQAELAAAVTKNAFETGAAPSRMAIHDGVVYTLNSLANTMTINSASDYSQSGTVSFPVGSGPYGIVFDGDTAYICTNGDNKIYKYRAGQAALDSETVSLEQPATEGWMFIGPGDMAVVGQKLYVPLAGIVNFGDASQGVPTEYASGMVAVINLGTFQFERFINVGTVNPTVCHAGAANQLFIVCTGELQFDSSFTPRAESDGEVVFYNTNTQEIVHRANLGRTLPSAIVSPNMDAAYVGSNLKGEAYKIRLDSGAVLRGPSNPIALTGEFTYVSGFAGLPGLGVVALSFNTDEAFFIDPVDDSVSKAPFTQPFNFKESGTFFGGLQHAAFYDTEGAKKLFVLFGVANQAGVVDFAALWDRIRLGEG